MTAACVIAATVAYSLQVVLVPLFSASAFAMSSAGDKDIRMKFFPPQSLSLLPRRQTLSEVSGNLTRSSRATVSLKHSPLPPHLTYMSFLMWYSALSSGTHHGQQRASHMIKGCLIYPTLTGCNNEQGRPLPAGGAVAAYQVHPVGVHHPRGGVAARRCRHTLYVNLHKFVLVAARHVQPRV